MVFFLFKGLTELEHCGEPVTLGERCTVTRAILSKTPLSKVVVVLMMKFFLCDCLLTFYFFLSLKLPSPVFYFLDFIVSYNCCLPQQLPFYTYFLVFVSLIFFCTDFFTYWPSSSFTFVAQIHFLFYFTRSRN